MLLPTVGLIISLLSFAMATKAAFQAEAAQFRQHLPDLSTPRFTVSKQQNPYEYVDDFQKSHVPPWLYNLTETWKELLHEPFKGVTSDGKSIVYSLLRSEPLIIT